jgi:Mn2+/Fe2+ NRAMP family transporter
MGHRIRGLLATLAPGILVAATGVGVGDIAGAGFAGSHLGYAILWAAVVGAFVKFVVNEGLTRWQLATGQTILEGAVLRFGVPVQLFFLVYLLVWSYAVGSALISACGIAGHAIFPVFDDAQTGKIVWGIVHSAAAVLLILLGGFKRFTQAMTALLLFTFVSVLATAVVSKPDWAAVARGLFIPRIPTEMGPKAAQWTLVVMGGVGGTLTMLCYGYWIREQGRTGPEFLKTCRFDLAVSYTVTAFFGVAMIIIGSRLDLAEGQGTGLILKVADHLGQSFGATFRWLFLIGAWATIFDSLLGVWQSVPYLFCDFWQLTHSRRTHADGDRVPSIDPRSPIYRGYLFALATLPAISLWFNFVRVQKAYSILGAIVMPLLALALLVMNSRSDWVGRHRNRPLTLAVLTAILLFFLYAAYLTFVIKKDILA